MRKILILLALAATLPAGCAGVPVVDPQLAVQIGQRQLDEDDWAPLEDQRQLGVDVALLGPFGFGGEVGLAFSQDDETVTVLGQPVELDGRVWELYGGVRKAWPLAARRLQPYVGGGVSLASARIEADSPLGFARESDSSLGLYLRGGLDVFLAGGFFLGLDLRYLLGTEVELAGASGDVDGPVVAARLGWAF